MSPAVTLLGTVALGLATHALYDLIQAALIQRAVLKRTILFIRIMQLDPGRP
jgi:hypothetical protein